MAASWIRISSAVAALLLVSSILLQTLAAEEEEAQPSSVLTLDASNFADTVSKHPFVVVEFYTTWCGHCKKLAPEYEKAASILSKHDPPVILTKVDANEEVNKELASKYEIKGYPTLKILRDGGKHIQDYKGPRNADGIVEYLKKQAGPASAEIKSSEDADKFFGDKKIYVVGVFSEFSGEEFENFTAAAEKLRSDYDFSHTSDANLLPHGDKAVKPPLVRLLKPFDELFVDSQDFHVEALEKFIESSSIPIITTYNKDPSNHPFVIKFFNSPDAKVVGVPVTLNGDLKNQFLETNVGFDTVCKVNSQLISNVCLDAISAGKYYYFIRLMGRKASHVALECALQSHPNMLLLGEVVSLSKLTILDITKQICDTVQARAKKDKYHGVILIPEGLVESIPELYALLQEIHNLQNEGVSTDDISYHLSPWASALFEFLPSFIRKELLLPPESDNSAQLSQIETEKLLATLVEAEMDKRMKQGAYKGKKFNAVCHFFGYQARGSLPSKFDCDYAYVLGHICCHILATGLNGYMATVTNLKRPVYNWRCGAAPLTE